MRTRHAFPVLTGLGFLFLFLAQALAAPTAAHAHGDTVKVVVTGQREGHVTTDITWENDGDAIEEAVAATVNATSPDGSRSMGPWRLVRDAGTRTGWSTAEVLPPGSWKVTVDVGFPSLGHGEKEIAVPVVDPVPSAAASGAPAPSVPPVSPVASTPAPSQTPSQAASQVPSPAGSPSASPAGEGQDSAVWWTTAGVAVIALAGAAAGVLLRRARARKR